MSEGFIFYLGLLKLKWNFKILVAYFLCTSSGGNLIFWRIFMKYLIGILCLLFANSAVASTTYRGYSSYPEPLPSTEGELLYRESGCTVCHGYQGIGDGFFADGLNPIPKDFTDPDTLAGVPDARLKQAIRKGVPGTAMPSFAQFSDYQIVELIRYIKSLAQTAPDESPFFDARRLNWTGEGPINLAPSQESSGTKAVKSYRKGFSRKYPSALFWVRKNKPGRAVSILEAALKNVSDRDGSLLLGYAYLKSGKLISAVRNFEAAVAGDSKDPFAHALLGTALLKLKDGRAVSHLKKAVQLDPGDSLFHALLGNAMTRMKNQEALNHLKEAVRLDPSNGLAHTLIGNLHFLDDEYSDAKRHYLRAVEEDPENSSAHFNLAALYDELGDGISAVIHMRHAETLFIQEGNLKRVVQARKRTREFYMDYGLEPADFDLTSSEEKRPLKIENLFPIPTP